MNTNDFLSPVVLTSAQFTLPNNGDFSAIDPAQLLNPNRTAMLVDEIRIGGGAAAVNDFAQLFLDLKLGGVPLTNGAVPIRSFMPTYTSYKNPNDLQLTWHFPRPMYVPPDVQISATVTRKTPSGWNIDGADTPFLFTIAGRSLPSSTKPPAKISVPWACATIVSTAVPYTSTNAEIVNPHDEPLHMSYLCGFQMSPALGSNAVILAPVTVQATFSNNKILIRDPVPFMALFPPNRPVMRMSGLLQPKQFATFTLDLPVLGGYTNMVFTTIGLCGYREIETPRGAQS